VRKGTSVGAFGKDMMDIDPVSVTSVARTLSSTVISSPTINTKTGKKRKAEDEMATHLRAHEKRPRTVAVWGKREFCVDI
jgi:hypothetical protein